MRYMYLIKAEKEFEGPPPQRLMDEMDKLLTKRIAEKSLIDTAGLLPSTSGVQVALKQGKLSVIDGPFTESKEVVGGYAIFEFATREQAMESLMEFMELHRLYAEGFELTCEMRPIGAGPDLPGCGR